MTPAFRAAVAAALLGLAATPAPAGRLSDATSPYLRLHADDAIDWYPWGEEALARTHDRPIFLSIGYASCYWCHVQARNTFADARVIAVLNERFVSILVDQDERPDVSGYYMEVMRAMTGRSGSPANLFLTPDLVPLFAAGYLAPEPEYGAPGFLEVAQALAEAWNADREGVLRNAEAIRAALRDLASARAGATPGTEDPRTLAARTWAASFDEAYGGFGGESKFLLPNVLSFLLGHAAWRGDDAIRTHVLTTLDHMAAGGVRDQLGGAFHRYATDRFWQVPHFEIMLAENALLARVYLEAYQASGRPLYAAVARGVLDDLLARLRLDGGFAASLDAETHATEGRFYTWTEAEIRTVLGAEAEPFLEAYLDQAHGLVAGRSVLRLLDGPEGLAKADDLAESRARLRAARAEREPPSRDDKVVTSWNALAVSAYAKAAQILDDARYRQVAREEMRRLRAAADAHGVTHTRLGAKAGDAVFLDDYAFLAEALLDLYETDFQVTRLDRARALMKTVLERFQHAPGAPFRLTPIDHSSVIPTRTVLDDDGVPSGNAAALVALHRLVLFGAEELEEPTRTIAEGLGGHLDGSTTGLLRALDYGADEAHEIVIVGELADAATQALLREVYARPLHGTVLAVIARDAPRENARWPLLAGRPLIDGKPTAYVCRKRLCDWPVNTPEELAAQLDALVTRAR